MLYTYIYYTYTFAYISNVVKSLHLSELVLRITPLDIPKGITSVSFTVKKGQFTTKTSD